MTSDYSLFLSALNNEHPEWSREAFAFICRGIISLNISDETAEDINADHIVKHLCLHSLNEYGPLALFTLNKLNFEKNNDFISALNLLIEKKIISGIKKVAISQEDAMQNLSSKLPKKALLEPSFWPKIKKVDNFQKFR